MQRFDCVHHGKPAWRQNEGRQGRLVRSPGLHVEAHLPQWIVEDASDSPVAIGPRSPEALSSRNDAAVVQHVQRAACSVQPTGSLWPSRRTAEPCLGSRLEHHGCRHRVVDGGEEGEEEEEEENAGERRGGGGGGGGGSGVARRC